MSGAEQPQDLRCPCSKKLAEVMSRGIVIKCRGCEQDVVIPFAELRSAQGVLKYLAGLPPRRPGSVGVNESERDEDWTLNARTPRAITRDTESGAQRPALSLTWSRAQSPAPCGDQHAAGRPLFGTDLDAAAGAGPGWRRRSRRPFWG